VSWWRRLLQRDRVERQLEAELRDHLERLADDYRRSGLSEQEARRKARLEFGGLEQVKEDCRDARGTRWLEDIAQDLRYGLRLLRQSPGFTVIAVASLALGIGANSAIFALVDGVILKTLPVRDPGRLVLLDDGSWTNPIWEQIRDRQLQFSDGAAAWGDARFDLSAGGTTEFAEGLWTSGSFFEMLGVPAVLGRTLTAADDRRSGSPDGPVAVISYAFWQRRFGGEAGVIGRTLTLNRVAFTVVGVTPPSFLGPSAGQSFDVAVPLATQAIVAGSHSWLDARSTWVLEIMARLKPAQTPEQATLAFRAIQPQIRAATLPDGWPPEHLESYLRDGLTFVSAAAGPAAFRTRYERPLLIIMAVVVLVLLIACANIANLLLARAAGRRHELTLRLALGASRFRIARQLLVESLLLAVIGAGFGLIFAQWGSRLIVGQLSTPRGAVALDLTLDWRVVGFTALVAVLTALLFGVAPALRVRGVDPHDALKEQGRTLTGERRRTFGAPLLVVQVALTLVLVVAAGLFMRTFGKLATLDIGLDKDAILVVDVNASRSGVHPAARLTLFDRVRAAAAAVPGVSGAGFSLITPVSGSGWNGPVELTDRPNTPRRERLTFFNSVTPGWFAAYGTRLLAGRDFADRDTVGAPEVGIVNETFARRYVKGNPLGQTIRFERGPGGKKSVQVIGVVEDAAYRSVRDPVPPVVFLPLVQAHAGENPASLSLSVRAASGSPALLTRTVAAAIAGVDPDLSLTFRPLAAFVDGALVRERLLAMLSGFFGGLALLLAGIGLYGMTSYAVSRRRTEIGIRMALGAHSSRVVALMLRKIAIPVGLGLIAGAGLSFWASRYVTTLLYGLEPRDPVTLIGAVLFLSAVSAFAAWLPARRAARIDPARVLRDG
jgi:putative ABC transport system permease protein